MRCEHKDTVTTAAGLEFCAACGLQMIHPPPAISLNSAREQRAIALGSEWHDMGDMPPRDEPYYVAGQNPPGVWHVRRVGAGACPPHWASHWRNDALGLPLGPSERLMPVAALR